MKKDNWNGLMKILWLEQRDKDGNVIASQKNIYNMFHTEGEAFLLRAAFVGGSEQIYVPDNYYFGLDNRTTVAAGDTMDTISTDGNEPTTNGYLRQSVLSQSQFTPELTGGNYRVLSPIVAFSATGGDWGPVRNMFLTDRSDNSGSLIATATLSQPLTVEDGHVVSLRMALSLKDCAS